MCRNSIYKKHSLIRYDLKGHILQIAQLHLNFIRELKLKKNLIDIKQSIYCLLAKPILRYY